MVLDIRATSLDPVQPMIFRATAGEDDATVDRHTSRNAPAPWIGRLKKQMTGRSCARTRCRRSDSRWDP
jgi:hypothetical protein